jgi:hypothetical protein
MAKSNEKPKPDGGERVFVPQKPPARSPEPVPAPQGPPESTPQQTPSSGSDSSSLQASDLLQEAMVVQRPPVAEPHNELAPPEHLIEPAGAEGRTVRVLAGEIFVPQRPPVAQVKASLAGTTEPLAPEQADPKPAPEADKSK